MNIKEQSVGVLESFYWRAPQLFPFGIGLLRLSLITILLWIGGLKFASYEAEGIVPLVSNSPMMSFFYHYPSPEYQKHLSRQGEVNLSNRRWHEENGTYPFSYGLGGIIVVIGLLIALHPLSPQIAAFGSLLLVGMSCVTLTFLVTTPEAWVPPLGSSTHGFPFLSIVGTAIVKDILMLGGSVVIMVDSATAHIERNSKATRHL